MKDIKTVFILTFAIIILFLTSSCGSPGKPIAQTTPSLATTSVTAATTASPAPSPTSSTTTSLVITPVTPISPEEAKRLALEYASKKLGIPVEMLRIWGEESGIYDYLSWEKVEIYAIADEQSQRVVVSAVIDPTSGKAMSLFDYQTMVGNRYKEVAGNINPGLYQKLQDKADNYPIKVKVFPKGSESQAAAFIESQGFPTRTVNLVTGGRIIYCELPKNLILELAKRSDVGDIEEDVPYAVP